MNTVNWVVPESLDDVRRLVAEGARLHGGGTGLMRNRPTSGTIVDLSRLDLGACEAAGERYRFGGTATITDIVATIAAHEPDHIVVRALSRMAAPSLRNRITIGGSIALFPPWSSVIGPLLASDAGVRLVGAHEETVPLADYLERKTLRAGTAVVDVEVARQGGLSSSWFSYARTRFNYPLFSVAIVGRGDAGLLHELRIVVTGNRGRYARLTELETRFEGASAPEQLEPGALGVSIPDRQGESGEYLTHRVAVAVARGLRTIAEGGSDE